MKISDINPSSLIDYIDSAEKLRKIRTYKKRDDVENYLPLLIHQVGFYGQIIGDEIYALPLGKVSFDSSEDIHLVIEGNIDLPSLPVNLGDGSIVIDGSGSIVVDGEIVFSNGSSELITKFIEQTASFSVPENSSKVHYKCDFSVDSNVIIEPGTLTKEGDVMYFEQMNMGKIVFVASGVTIRLGLTQSLESVGMGDKISFALELDSSGNEIYVMY